MKLFEYIERLKRIHLLIKRKQTGTPGELASKLGISISQLYNIIDELKDRGAPIAYCRAKKAFYYKSDFEMTINYEFKVLTNHEQQITQGGWQLRNIFPSNFIGK